MRLYDVHPSRGGLVLLITSMSITDNWEYISSGS